MRPRRTDPGSAGAEAGAGRGANVAAVTCYLHVSPGPHTHTRAGARPARHGQPSFLVPEPVLCYEATRATFEARLKSKS